jgi:hypothetical protein
MIKTSLYSLFMQRSQFHRNSSSLLISIHLQAYPSLKIVLNEYFYKEKNFSALKAWGTVPLALHVLKNM